MYGTIADWRAYGSVRGDSAPANAADADATAALTRASDYVRMRYVANLLPGYGATLQPSGYDYPLIEEAAYLIAGYELSTPGLFSGKTYTPAQQKVLVGLDTIRWQVVSSRSKTYGAVPVLPLVDAMFEPYIADPNRSGFMLKSIGGGE